jgi:hypothetical protein
LAVQIGEGPLDTDMPEYHPSTITFPFRRAENYIADKSKILRTLPRNYRSSWIEAKQPGGEIELA